MEPFYQVLSSVQSLLSGWLITEVSLAFLRQGNPALRSLALLISTSHPSLDVQTQDKQELSSPAVREGSQTKLHCSPNAVNMKLLVKQVRIPRQAAVSREGCLGCPSVICAIANVAPLARDWQRKRLVRNQESMLTAC